MKKTLMMAVLALGVANVCSEQRAVADHGCAYGGYSYGVPVYSYTPGYAYAVPAYSYGPTYQSVYAPPAYGYSSGISISFGHGHYGGHNHHWIGHGGHFGGYGGHYGGGHHWGHHGGHHGGHH